MNFHIVTLMPLLVESGLKDGVVGAAFEKGICKLNLINPRGFTEDLHKTVDDRPFGGGDGMLMLAEPLERSLQSIQNSGPVYYLSPQGIKFTDKMARSLAIKKNLTLICGRYGGVDQRFINKNNIQEISIGDFILSGGELAAMVIIDAVSRLLPGVLGHKSSADQDSFTHSLLEAPCFTRPQEWCGMKVPPVLLSGNHKKIDEFKKHMSITVTLLKRPDLVDLHKHKLKLTLEYLTHLQEENFEGLPMSKEAILVKFKEVISG